MIDDIASKIRESATATAAYLELPTEDDLVIIEEEILLHIPAEFRYFLLQVSDVVLGSLEPVTVADPGSHTHLPEVTATAWDKGLPRDLMVVCQTGNNYYCINHNGEILYWENGELTEQLWIGIWQWAEQVWLNS